MILYGGAGVDFEKDDVTFRNWCWPMIVKLGDIEEFQMVPNFREIIREIICRWPVGRLGNFELVSIP